MGLSFIGQPHIIGQLSFLLPELLENPSSSQNFLLRAASGQGKTHLAHKMCQYLANDWYSTSLGNFYELNLVKRVCFLDEVHIFKQPEIMYPYMDSGNNIFIFATNEFANLPEALENRCVPLTFTGYTDEDLRLIIDTVATYDYDVDQKNYLIKSGGRNPRIIISLVKRLNIYNYRNSIPTKIGDFKELLKNIFGIVNGLDPIAASYLEVLTNNGGTASVSVISGAIRIDENTLKNRIEPILLANNLIQITRKGRVLNDNSEHHV